MNICIMCGKVVEGTDLPDFEPSSEPAEQFCIAHWDELVEINVGGKKHVGPFPNEEQFQEIIKQATKEDN